MATRWFTDDCVCYSSIIFFISVALFLIVCSLVYSVTVDNCKIDRDIELDKCVNYFRDGMCIDAKTLNDICTQRIVECYVKRNNCRREDESMQTTMFYITFYGYFTTFTMWGLLQLCPVKTSTDNDDDDDATLDTPFLVKKTAI